MKINRVLQSTMLLLAVVNMASSTEFTTTAAGNWNSETVWGSVGGYPQAADDVANVNHSTVKFVSAVPVLPSTAYLNSGGTLLLDAHRSVRVLHLGGGLLNCGGYNWLGQGGTGQVHIAGNSYWRGGNMGSATDRYVVHGSGTLTVVDKYSCVFNAAAGSDFSGTVVVSNDVAYTCVFPNAESLWNIHVATNRIIGMGDINLVYTNRTMSGRGTLRTYNGYRKSWTFGAGSVLRPGSPDAPDSAVFTLKCYSGNETMFFFDPGSKLVLDIVDVDKSDRVESVDAAANKITISSDALLEVNLFTPHDTLAINNMVLWNANATLNGMFSEAKISFNNAEGWKSLSVAKSSDGKQILFSGEFVGARTVLVIR